MLKLQNCEAVHITGIKIEGSDHRLGIKRDILRFLISYFMILVVTCPQKNGPIIRQNIFE